MIRAFNNMTIVRKFKFIISFVAFSILFNLFGMYEIAKTGYFQFLEREHIELVMLLNNRFLEFKSSPDSSEQSPLLTQQSDERVSLGMLPLLKKIILQPQKCLSDVIAAEVLIFKIIGFGAAFELCEQGIKDDTQSMSIINQYISGGLEKQEFIQKFGSIIEQNYINSHKFAKIIPEARDFVKNLMLVTNLILSVFVIGILIFSSYTITKPLLKLKNFIIHLENDRDLTKRLQVTSKDEVGDITSSLNKMLHNFETILVGVHHFNTSLVEATRDLSQLSSENNINIQEQHKKTDSSAAATNQITTSITEVSVNFRDAVESAESILKGVESTDNHVKSTKGVISRLVEGMTATSEAMSNLEESSNKIGDILNVIKGIADQTNLLALNASIEAARAGDHGRGFAVVADEVRQLAFRTQQSVDDIQQMIDIIQNASQNVVLKVEDNRQLIDTSMSEVTDASEKLKSVCQLAQNIKIINEQISPALKEQTHVMEEMNKSIHDIADLADLNAHGADKVSGISKKVVDTTEEASSLLQKFKVSNE